MTEKKTSLNNFIPIVPGKWRLPAALIFVAILTFAVYAPVLHNEFINYDDIEYVTANPVVQQGLTGQGFIWAFTTNHTGNWHPLTWLSHMLDVQLFGLNPMGHHFTNLLFHIANSLLLLVVLHRMTGAVGRSLVVSLLFALHPLHVESVAWVAERKDVLSSFFWFLTMWAYLKYAERPCLNMYIPVAGFFVMGLMAKQMLVTLPVILLLLDYWPLNRLGSGPDKSAAIGAAKLPLLEKLPLFVLSAAASIVVVYAQSSAGTINDLGLRALADNAGNACISYVKYIWMMLWPAKLAVFYPFDPAAITPLKVAGAVCLLALITGLAVMRRRERPYLAFGWMWYLVTLLPVIGFLGFGAQALADRYTYIPLTGLFVMIVWGCAELCGKWRDGALTAAVGGVAVVSLFSILTREQTGYWRSNIELFSHTLAVTEKNWVAHNNVGTDLLRAGKVHEAIHHYQESVRLNPTETDGFTNLGNACLRAGEPFRAIAALREAIRLEPNNVEARYYLGIAYLRSGNRGLAHGEYLQLKRLNEELAASLYSAVAGSL